MKIIVFILTLYTLLKTIGYAVFEIKNKNNKPAGIIIILLSIFGFIFPNIMTFMR